MPVPFIKIALANPSSWHVWSPPELAILSPLQNETYSSTVPLSLKITLYMKGWSMESLKNLSYSLDGKPDIILFPSYSYNDDLVVRDKLSGLNDGQHTLIVHGLTDWYNTFSSNVTFTVDNRPAVQDYDPLRISILSPENETYTNFGKSLPLNFSVNKPFAWAKLSLDDGANKTIDGNMSIDCFEFFVSNSSCHSVTVYAIDTAGNIGASSTVYFALIFLHWNSPLLPPIVGIISPQSTTLFKSNVPLTFTIDKTIQLDPSFVANFTKILRVRYSLDGQNNVTIAGNTTLTGLPNGEHNVTVYAEDTVGNFRASQTIFFTVKAEPFPIVTTVAITGASSAVAAVVAVVYLKKRKIAVETA